MARLEQNQEDRKAFLTRLNEIAQYTAEVIHGEDVPKGRVKQYKKYFNKTYKMIHRLAIYTEINNHSFKYGYGGKVLARRVMLDMGIVKKQATGRKKTTYTLLITPDEITLELVARIIVEVYLIRNDVKPL